jgi:hypothetical protein
MLTISSAGTSCAGPAGPDRNALVAELQPAGKTCRCSASAKRPRFAQTLQADRRWHVMSEDTMAPEAGVEERGFSPAALLDYDSRAATRKREEAPLA